MEKVELTFEETLEFNKMCAELLVENNYVQHSELKFHTSWDWIMEVWIKLNQIYSQKGLYSYEIFHNNSIILCFKEIGLLCGDLKIAVECLYKFLKIYFETDPNK